MTSISSKICIVGDFAVGKTSIAERFVNNQFSEKYLTTVGVKIDTREIARPELGITHKLIIWDIAGSDQFDATQVAYLRGAAGCLYVADGTRPDTLKSVINLNSQIDQQLGAIPSAALVNKNDLRAQWMVDDEQLHTLGDTFSDVFLTSAKTGHEVDHAITEVARQILDGYLREG